MSCSPSGQLCKQKIGKKSCETCRTNLRSSKRRKLELKSDGAERFRMDCQVLPVPLHSPLTVHQDFHPLEASVMQHNSVSATISFYRLKNRNQYGPNWSVTMERSEVDWKKDPEQLDIYQHLQRTISPLKISTHSSFPIPQK